MMGRVAWLPIILILVVRCQGLDVTTSKRPAHLSGVKDQAFDGSITTATFLNSFQHSFKQTLYNLENIMKAQLQFQDGLKEQQTLQQAFLNNEIELQNSRFGDKFVQLEKDFNDEIEKLENEMQDRFKSVDEKRKSFGRAPCHRDMTNNITNECPDLVLMMDYTLNRDILCDTKTDGGGWIVIQRRTHGDVDFYNRTWEKYKNGFGTLPGDFWLGNEATYNLTSEDSYELRIEILHHSRYLFAVYSSFRLESEADNYRIWLGSHSGTLEEDNTNHGLSFHNGSQFSTLDKDNDGDRPVNCTEKYTGAWWYTTCAQANLNGYWKGWRFLGTWWFTGSHTLHVTSTEMKIRLI